MLEAFEAVEGLQLSQLVQLPFRILQVGLLLHLSLPMRAQVVKDVANGLLLHQQVVIGSEERVQILVELGLQEEDFDYNFLFEPAADVTNDTCFQRVLQSQFESVLAVG